MGPSTPETEASGILRRRRPEIAAAVVLIVLFSLSVVVRLPALDMPLSALRHGEGTARVLRHIDIWEEVGITDARFMMRTTHTAPADRYVRDVGYLPDGEGVYYYASFPPLFPLAPYAASQATGVSATVASLRWWNLLLQALGVASVFLLARRGFREMGPSASAIAATVAGGTYIVAPVLLWYHSAAYVTTSLSTPLFAFAAYLAVCLLHDEVVGRWRWVAYVGTVALLAYTEWLAVTFALAAVGWWLLRRAEPRARHLALATMGTVGVVIALTVAQYSTVAGLSALVESAGGKYVMRSGFAESSHASVTSVTEWGNLLRVYWLSFAPLVFLPGILAAPAFVDASVRGGMRRLLAGPLGTALWLTGVATLLHHLLFFSHTVLHDFDMMKSAVPIALLIALVVIGGFSSMRRSIGLVRAGTALAILAALVSITSLGWSMEKNFVYANAAKYFGEAVREADVAPDEVVFLESNGFYAGSAATYYAGRNIANYRNPEAAALLMERNGASGGVLFVIDPATNAVGQVVYLVLDGTPSTGADVVIP